MPKAILLLPLLISLQADAADFISGTLTVLSGAPQVQVVSKNVSRKETSKGSVFPGDQIRTASDQSVLLTLTDESNVTLSRYVDSPTDHVAEIDMGHGMLYTVVSKGVYTDKKPFTIRTPSAAMGVRGTEFVVENSEKGEVTLHTLEGSVAIGKTPADLVRPGAVQLVSAGNMSSANSSPSRPSAPAHFDQKIFMKYVGVKSPGVAKQIQSQVQKHERSKAAPQGQNHAPSSSVRQNIIQKNTGGASIKRSSGVRAGGVQQNARRTSGGSPRVSSAQPRPSRIQNTKRSAPRPSAKKPAPPATR